MNKVKVPPIKTQGIKTKLVPLIIDNITLSDSGTFIEPFLGSGVVAFNLNPKKAILADTNKHIINFYIAIQNNIVNAKTVREYLTKEGEILLLKGEEHYYFIRERFNKEHNPFDFLFLNRACFNGLMRFNAKGGFNVPFCRKPKRFDQSYITKICNQVAWVNNQMKGKEWQFKVQDWKSTLHEAKFNDFLYLDPPYIGRNANYFNVWSESDADDLANKLQTIHCGFAYSMWKKNKFRENEHLIKWFSNHKMVVQEHFYHIGSSEELRHSMEEALIIKND